MSLTRLFVARPTLVTVFLALVLLAGTIAGFSLVQQQFPSTDVPSIQVLLNYPGASTTEMRDAIVRPLEDQLAGAPNLDHLETSIQPGAASIVAVFQLSSDQNNDLVQVQGRVQNAQHSLPNDVTAPQISLYNPSEAVVVSLVLRSRSLGAGDLSSLTINKIVPSLEQITGVSYVQENGTVTPSLQVNVNPQALSSSGFTLTDIISAITNNNVRAPGGILYAPNRETNLDVRGDIQNVATVADLLLGSGSTSATTTNPFTTQSRLFRIGDVASVADSYETQRVYAYSGGVPCVTLEIQKSAGTSEVETSRRRRSAVQFSVGADVSKQCRSIAQICLTLPILEGTDGKIRMGKSRGNYIALTEPARAQFRKVMSIPDELIARWGGWLISGHKRTAMPSQPASPPAAASRWMKRNCWVQRSSRATMAPRPPAMHATILNGRSSTAKRPTTCRSCGLARANS